VTAVTVENVIETAEVPNVIKQSSVKINSICRLHYIILVVSDFIGQVLIGCWAFLDMSMGKSCTNMWL